MFKFHFCSLRSVLIRPSIESRQFDKNDKLSSFLEHVELLKFIFIHENILLRVLRLTDLFFCVFFVDHLVKWKRGNFRIGNL